MTDLALWQFIRDRLSSGKHVVLLCVVESSGSSPGRQGFKMAVASDDFFGSIGGGIMEHKFVELAKEYLIEPRDPLLKKQLHNKSASKDQSGMICSGEQTIVLMQLRNSHLHSIEKIISTLIDFKTGRLEISAGQLLFSEVEMIERFEFQSTDEKNWKYAERIGYTDHLYIVGGGHCSNALSQMMSSMDFFIHVYDERNDLNTFIQNDFANEKTLVDDYSALANLIPSGKNNYVVIMTFGYRTDDIALRSLIINDYKYIGILGSQAKIAKMKNEWEQSNLPKEKLEKLHAPVGLPINSQTPLEIAVSIAAEIISIKNSGIKEN
jgi:xanthine dehydrogenase accessory factor